MLIPFCIIILSYIYETQWDIHTRGSSLSHVAFEFVECTVLREFL